MLIKPFGGAFTLNYYPKVDGEPFDPPSQTPSIYVFDSNPSIDMIDNGTNAIGSEIASWGEGTANVRTITIPAIADPGDSTKRKRYWVGLKYTAVTGGSDTYDIELFELVRPDGHTAEVEPTATEVKARDNELVTFYPTDTPIDNVVDGCIVKLKAHFRSQGVQWYQIKNPEELKDVIIWFALQDLYLAKRKEPDDFFDLKFRAYKTLFEGTRDALEIEFDSNEDNDISESEAEKKPSHVVFVR